MAKVLLVDDDQELSNVFSTSLSKDGFQVVVAYDGKTGIDKAKTEKPDMILLDQILPDLKGNDILKTLKSDPETKEIPVALLSNFGENELIQEALNLGAIDYILKYQVETQDLSKKVTEILKESQGNP